MERTRALRLFGTIGLATGIAAMVGGGYAGELGGFVTGYGLLVVLSATYLLLGLAVRERLAHRPRSVQRPLPAPQVIR
jgi:hypothetical protein